MFISLEPVQTKRDSLVRKMIKHFNKKYYLKFTNHEEATLLITPKHQRNQQQYPSTKQSFKVVKKIYKKINSQNKNNSPKKVYN